MTSGTTDPQTRPCWFVGAVFSNGEDQLSRFLKDDVWEIEEPTLRDRSFVNDMKVRDRIAIKSTFTRKNNLPFDNRGNSVSVMAIKAVGRVIENPGNEISGTDHVLYARTALKERVRKK